MAPPPPLCILAKGKKLCFASHSARMHYFSTEPDNHTLKLPILQPNKTFILKSSSSSVFCDNKQKAGRYTEFYQTECRGMTRSSRTQQKFQPGIFCLNRIQIFIFKNKDTCHLGPLSWGPVSSLQQQKAAQRTIFPLPGGISSDVATLKIFPHRSSEWEG